jgi:hypothetical protein
MSIAQRIISKHWQTVGWIITIIVSVTVSQLLIRLPSEIIISEILLLFLIVFFICYLVLQSIKTTQDLNLMNSLDRIPYDMVQPLLQKKLSFTSKSLETGICQSETFRLLKNNMDEDSIYNDFKVEYESKDHVPTLDCIRAFVNKEEVDLKKINPQTCMLCETDKNYTKPTSTKYTTISFDIPVGIEAGQEKSLKVVFQTEAFKKALSGGKDSITLNCARITEKLIFEIRISEDLQKTHYLSKCVEKDVRRGGPLEFIIEDGSNQRMTNAEIELRKKKNVPSWKTNIILWDIPNPKVNYNYTLYFTILESKIRTFQDKLV